MLGAMMRTSEDSAGSVMILSGDVNKIKQINEILSNAGYNVMIARSMVEVLESLLLGSPEVMIICRDACRVEPQKIYDRLQTILRSKNIRSVLLEDHFFAEELVDRVRNALK